MLAVRSEQRFESVGCERDGVFGVEGRPPAVTPGQPWSFCPSRFHRRVTYDKRGLLYVEAIRVGNGLLDLA